MKKGFGFLFFFVLASSSYAQKTMEQYWADTGFSTARIDMSNRTCHWDQKRFIGCIRALGTALSFEKGHPVLIPTSRVSEESGFGATLRVFQNVSVVLPKPEGDTADRVGNRRKERKLSNAALDKLYQERESRPVDFEEIWAYVKQGPVFRTKPVTTAVAMNNAVLGVLEDPHTRLLSKESYLNANVTGGKNFGGLGFRLRIIQKSGKPSMVVVGPGTGPAFKAGIRAGDRIAEIDGTPVEQKDYYDLFNEIKGSPGSEVKLKVVRGATTLDFALRREIIEVKNVENRMVGARKDVGYVRLADFNKRSQGGKVPVVYSETRDAVRGVVGAGARGIVFDLRGNHGGILEESVRVASLFLKKGSLVVETRGINRPTIRRYVTSDPPVTDLPLVVLINAVSASAAELVAGALQDFQRAFIVGERTFGKGTVQFLLNVKGFPKLWKAQTTERFFQPLGHTNQVVGILPDVEVYRTPQATAEDKTASREEDEYNALPPTGPKWVQPRPDEVQKLQDCLSKGAAKADFATAVADGREADFQLLTGVDVIDCQAAAFQ